MTTLPGGIAWTEKGGLCVPKLTRILEDSGEVIGDWATKELGASKSEDAVKRIILATPISPQLVQMQTGH